MKIRKLSGVAILDRCRRFRACLEPRTNHKNLYQLISSCSLLKDDCWALYLLVCYSSAYYPWVPFVLGLQCILFYLPHLIWEAICNSRAGGDVFSLVQAANKAASGDRADRKRQVSRVAEFLEDMITTHIADRRVRNITH